MAPRVLLPLALAAAVLATALAAAADTAETVLIRQVLEKDRFGRRRGDVELVLSTCDGARFVVYDAGGSIDPAAWSVRHGSPEAYAAALEAELEARRYEVERQVVFVNEWKDKAFVTTLDTGTVVDRATGQRHPYQQQRLWTFRKREEGWFASAVVEALGDSTSGPGTGRVASEDVAGALGEEAGEWNDDSAGGILGRVDDDLVVVDAYGSSDPAKWIIIFADRDEFEEWLEDRLQYLDYRVERAVLHAAVDAEGREAVAVTRDRLSATYAGGDARAEQDRVTTWLLSRRGGTWKATWVLWQMKPFAAAGPTALR